MSIIQYLGLGAAIFIAPHLSRDHATLLAGAIVLIQLGVIVFA